MNCPNDMVVDHKNHIVFDNRKVNLRIVRPQQNSLNKDISINNTSHITGVSYRRKENKWESYITYYNKKIFIGLFSIKEDAIVARKEAEEKYFGEYSYDNSMKQY